MQPRHAGGPAGCAAPVFVAVLGAAGARDFERGVGKGALLAQEIRVPTGQGPDPPEDASTAHELRCGEGQGAGPHGAHPHLRNLRQGDHHGRHLAGFRQAHQDGQDARRLHVPPGLLRCDEQVPGAEGHRRAHLAPHLPPARRGVALRRAVRVSDDGLQEVASAGGGCAPEGVCYQEGNAGRSRPRPRRRRCPLRRHSPDGGNAEAGGAPGLRVVAVCRHLEGKAFNANSAGCGATQGPPTAYAGYGCRGRQRLLRLLRGRLGAFDLGPRQRRLRPVRLVHVRPRGDVAAGRLRPLLGHGGWRWRAGFLHVRTLRRRRPGR
mmetsp:Transcript_76807/g.199997  ORF Transcript_76807/g.199997 Transcript_76807/m.199997 type:complete len:321 (-) Transcript_76807:72-1034(-)